MIARKKTHLQTVASCQFGFRKSLTSTFLSVAGAGLCVHWPASDTALSHLFVLGASFCCRPAPHQLLMLERRGAGVCRWRWRRIPSRRPSSQSATGRPADRPTAFSYSFPATRQLGYGATARCEFEHGRTSDRMGLWIEQCDKCVTSTARSSVVNDTCVVDLGHYLTAVWPVTSALHSIATRSSAIAEEPRDALWQLKPC